MKKYLPKKLQKLVEFYDVESGMSDFEDHMISLYNGWCFDEEGTHVFGEDNLPEVIKSLKNRVHLCHCLECEKRV